VAHNTHSHRLLISEHEAVSLDTSQRPRSAEEAASSGATGICSKAAHRSGRDNRGRRAEGGGDVTFFLFEVPIRVKLAADETTGLSEEGQADAEQAGGGPDGPAGRECPGPRGKTVRVELEWNIPMVVTLPLQMEPDPAHQPFPFLDTTLADLGIQE